MMDEWVRQEAFMEEVEVGRTEAGRKEKELL